MLKTLNFIRNIILSFTLLLLPGTTAVHAQHFQATLTHYSAADGLCSNAVSDLRQDDYGYIWIASWNGLSRFDGYNFFNYNTGPHSGVPLMHNRIKMIEIDLSQNVWLWMYDDRVFVLDRTTDKIINPFEGLTGYQNFHSIHNAIVTTSGDVYVSIRDVGIYKLRIDKNGIKRSLITTGKFTPTTICEGYHGDLWIGTDHGIHRLNVSDESLERNGEFTDERITCMHSNGFNIYAGTESGKIVTFAYGQPAVVLADNDDRIHSVFVDSRNELWYSVGDKQGITKIDLNTGKSTDYTQNILIPHFDSNGAIIHEINGVVWINMNHGGFGYYNRDADKVEYFHNDPANPWNLSNTVTSFLPMEEGVIWETTSRRGLEKLEILKNTITRTLLVKDIGENTNMNEIRAMYNDGNRHVTLMGTKTGALFELSHSGQKQIMESGSLLGRIYGITKTSKGHYIICSKGEGIIFMIPDGNGGYTYNKLKHIPGDNMSLNNDNCYYAVEDKYGNFWIATYGGGVNLLTQQNGKWIVLHKDNIMRRYPHNSYQKVRNVALDNEGNVWAGTTDGILLLSYKNKKIKIQKLLQSKDPVYTLNSNDIVCLGLDNKGSMWIGTNGGGLSHVIGKDDDGRYRFENFGTQDGLPSEEIKSITFDQKGNVWFASDRAICSYNTSKRIFSTFDVQDGVDDTNCSECAAITLKNGNVIIGTINGFYTIDQKKLINSYGTMLKLQITDFIMDDKIITPRTDGHYDYYVPSSKSVELPTNHTHFGFRFASLNYQLQHRIHYQYMLEGYDHEWKNVDDSRTVMFSGLPSGTYKFKVKAFMLESPDKYDIREITVVIPPLFLLSSTAIWIYMLLAIVFFIGLLLWREKTILTKHLSAEEKIKVGTEGIDLKDQKDIDFMNAQLDWLEQHCCEPDLKPDALIKQSGMTRTIYFNQIKALTGLTPKEFIADFRYKKSQKLLSDGTKTVSEVAYSIGFNDVSDFIAFFTQKAGCDPHEYRKTNGIDDPDEAITDYEIIED